jgi:hypothetical protein
MDVLNLTPHPVAVVDGLGGPPILVLPPETLPARVIFGYEPLDDAGGLPLVDRVVTGHSLPGPVEGRVLVVSATVAGAFPMRHDLFVPDRLVRSPGGPVQGCRHLARNRFWR